MLGDLKQLRAVLAIARLGNFTRAAHELHISQSALTIQIQQIESQLGAPLFDRSRRHVSLTPQGTALLPRIEQLIGQMEDLITFAHQASDPERGVVTVAVLPSLGAGLLPQAIARLKQDYPRIEVRTIDTVATRVTDLIRNGDADFGLTSQVKRVPELNWENLMTDHFFAYMAHDYPWKTRRATSLKELAAHPLILPVRDSSVRMHIEAAADRQKILLPAAHEAVYNSTILAMAAEGLGVAVLSELAGRGGDTVRLRRVAITNPPVYRHIGLLRRAGRSLSRPSELLIQALRQGMAQSPKKAAPTP